jgi:hypothetical protein
MISETDVYPPTQLIRVHEVRLRPMPQCAPTRLERTRPSLAG